MPVLSNIVFLFSPTSPDIYGYEKGGDIPALLRLLNHPRPEIAALASAALGRAGPAAVDPLVKALDTGDPVTRLGAAEALGMIRSEDAVFPLVRTLRSDTSGMVRFTAALALGTIGDPAASIPLIDALDDRDHFVRFGAAMSLDLLPPVIRTPAINARCAVAKREWDKIADTGDNAVPPLADLLRSGPPGMKVRAIEILGKIHPSLGTGICTTALHDENPAVRWSATLTFPQCGFPMMDLPRALSKRKHWEKNPWIAAFLNTFFPGIGYHYLGGWYGFLIFLSATTGVMIASLFFGTILPYIAMFSLSSLIGLHAFRIARSMSVL